jgi:Na+/H+ antiporter NhaD/arsenite permease-like protein
MNLALLSLSSLVVAIVLSQIARLNVGVVALCFAWIIGYYFAEMSVPSIIDGFPLGLATILFGVTFLFGQAQANGTLDRLAGFVIRLAHGQRGLVPIIFFVIALGLATIGPGNIAAVALLAPIAMSMGGRAGVSAFLMTIMLANGANAGAFSPLAPTGIIANGLIARLGLDMNPWTQVYLPSLLAQSAIAFAGYLTCGGLQLWGGAPVEMATDADDSLASRHAAPITLAQWATGAAIVALLVGVIGFRADIGFLALSLALVVAVVSRTDQEEVIKVVPWDTIIMVCGVSTLIALLEETGGMDLFTTLLARIATEGNITAVIAFVTGLLSIYSSSSGVVMPAFIPTVPGLIEKLGGGDPVAIISAINVGSHVVDVSPLSTLGAMCIANAAAHEDRRRLFRNLLIWGLAMAFVGAGVCYLIFGLL